MSICPKACFNILHFKKSIYVNRNKSNVSYIDYGRLNHSNQPCRHIIDNILRSDKGGLGQSAAQTKCFFQSLPFILYKYRENPELKSVWICIESLLRIMEIIFSREIGAINIKDLSTFVSLHLESLKRFFDINLLPKHHIMLHYPYIIQTMGPLINMIMLKYESKHQQLKGLVKNTRNYKNINKSIAVKHQQLLCNNGLSYKDKMSTGLVKFLNKNVARMHCSLIRDYFGNLTEPILETSFFDYNNYEGIPITW